jgi:hypothetical protein
MQPNLITMFSDLFCFVMTDSVERIQEQYLDLGGIQLRKKELHDFCR